VVAIDWFVAGLEAMRCPPDIGLLPQPVDRKI
jgi:hypothetical protein